MTELLELLTVARTAGQQAATWVKDNRPPGRVGIAATKSSPTDIVTELDRRSEELIREIILSARPLDGFVGEEGQDVAASSEVTWVVDPIDGTANFVYGIPAYAVSIAAVIDGVSVIGYVVNIASGEEFGAIRGGGAWQWLGSETNAAREKLTGPPATSVDQLLVATGFNYDANVRRHQVTALALLLPQIRDIRRVGAAALDLVAIARGQVDAYVEQGLKPWDLAAGQVIATEAGLVLSGYDGPPDERLVMAARPDIAEEYFALIRACGF